MREAGRKYSIASNAERPQVPTALDIRISTPGGCLGVLETLSIFVLDLLVALLPLLYEVRDFQGQLKGGQGC